MAETNQLCAVCRGSPTMYCTCSSANTYLCDLCFLAHRNKNPRLVHTTVPIDVSEDVVGYQHRCQVFAAGRQELLSNLNCIDQCCEELGNAVEGFVTQVRLFKDDFIAKMQVWKTHFSSEINESVAEVERSLGEPTVQLRGAYSMALRNYTPGSLSLFRYQVNTSAFDIALRSLISTSFSPPSTQSTDLYWVTENTLQWFDVSTEQYHPPVSLSTHIQLNANSRFACLGVDKVIVVGGGADTFVWKSAYKVSKAGEVEGLPDMKYGHRSPGLIVWKGRAHVFGSYVGSGGCEGESWMEREVQWTALPQMRKQRSCFTPVIWDQAIYLCGGRNNTTVETYDGVDLRLLSLSLPEGGSMACLKGATLLLFTPAYFVILSKQGNDLTTTKTSRQGEPPASFTLPILWNDFVYSINNGNIVKFEVDTGKSRT